MSLDIGEFPAGVTDATDTTDDPERLIRIVSHLVARVGDRFTVIRKFSRHMEGQEKRAGVISDIVAAATELYKRNPETLEGLAKAYGKEFMTRQQVRKTAVASPTSNGRASSPVTQPTHPQ